MNALKLACMPRVQVRLQHDIKRAGGGVVFRHNDTAYLQVVLDSDMNASLVIGGIGKSIIGTWHDVRDAVPE